MNTLKEYDEKSFIRSVLGKYATTAKREKIDDCIIIDLSEFIRIPNAPYIVYSMDHPSQIKRKDLSRSENLRFYGRWTAACTCGDVLAMGTIPKGFSFDLAAPLETEVDDIENILTGLRQTLDKYDTVFEGGNFDTNDLETVCMAWGMVERNHLVTRYGAKPGDLVVATGELGVGWSGYLAEKLNLLSSLGDEMTERIRNYKLYPLAPHHAMRQIFSIEAITSGMDLSDGFVEFLYTIKERNNLGVEIDIENLPINTQSKKIGDLLNIRNSQLFCLEPGYDTPITHGWTIKPEKWDQVKNIFDKHNKDIFIYGTVTKSPEINIKNDNRKISIPPFWDDQFNKKNKINEWLKYIKFIDSKLSEV